MGENAKKYIIFSVPIEKEVTGTDKKGNKITKKHILQRLQFIDSTRFMVSSLSNLVNIIAERIHKIKCKYGNSNKKYETCGIKYKDCWYFLEYI